MVAKKKQELVATAAAVVWDDDRVRYQIKEGDIYDASHWIVKRMGTKFFITPSELAIRQGRVVVEQATAAPGETRNVKVPTE